MPLSELTTAAKEAPREFRCLEPRICALKSIQLLADAVQNSLVLSCGLGVLGNEIAIMPCK